MLTRKSGWEGLLSQYIQDNLDRRQEWGQADCSMFVCDWVLQVTGADPAKDFRGKYKTKAGAARAIKKFAGDLDGVAERIAGRLGMEETVPLKARRGDVVMVKGNGGNALGIIDMSGMAVAVQGKDGLEFVPAVHALKAWRVG